MTEHLALECTNHKQMKHRTECATIRLRTIVTIRQGIAHLQEWRALRAATGQVFDLQREQCGVVPHGPT